MNCENYDNFYLYKIIKTLNDDPYYSINKLEEYINNFPNDYFGYSYYLKLLIDVGRLDDADLLIKKIEDSTLLEKIDIHFLFAKLRVLVFKGKYEQAHELYTEHKEELLRKDPRTIVFEVIYARVKNLPLNTVDGPNSNFYFYNQFVNYSEKSFLNHIKKHLSSCTDEFDVMNAAMFTPEFPYKKVIEEIKRTIPNDKHLLYSFFNDLYVFKYDFCGRSNNKTTDYFKVIASHDTNNLITMYPYLYGECVPYTDFNYLNNNRSKVRRLSQIDKFNQKYNK